MIVFPDSWFSPFGCVRGLFEGKYSERAVACFICEDSDDQVVCILGHLVILGFPHFSSS
jgi:hypothetical protein